MSEILGKECEVGFAVESTRGTKSSNLVKWSPKSTLSLIEKANHIVDDSSVGKIEDAIGRRVVQKWIEGGIEDRVRADEIGYLFGSIYGKVTTTNVSGSVNDHTFENKTTPQHPTLTAFVKDGSIQQRALKGCLVNKLEIKAAADDYITYSAEFIGMEAEDDTTAVSYDTTYDFIGNDITIKIADTLAGLTAATPICASELTISHDQDVIKDFCFGNVSPGDVFNPKTMLEGSFNPKYVDNDLKDLYLGDGAKYMEIKMESSSDIGGGNHPTITYILNKVQIMDWEKDGDNDSIVRQPVTFKAFYNLADSQRDKVTVRNLTASYPDVPTS